jgi:hypothetical protein
MRNYRLKEWVGGSGNVDYRNENAEITRRFERDMERLIAAWDQEVGE